MTAPYWTDDTVTLYLDEGAGCLTVLPTLPDASVDAVVCDPPYEIGFMGRDWDSAGIAYSVPMWAESLRVLKPGGHLLAFGAPRTYHRMACAIEDAGFEIRDSLHWVFGSGFPKSLDVSKAIDAAGGTSPAEQSAVLRAARERAGLTREHVAAAVGCTPASVRDWEEGRARARGRAVEHIVPSATYRTRLADLLGYTADERTITGVATDRRGDGTVIGLGHSGVRYGSPTTTAAQQWSGWGTALKPAHEPIVLARKPLVGTVARNVLTHDTGALNIDACRTGGGAGRWPTNLVLSHPPLLDDLDQPIADACASGCVPGCPVADMDQQSGVREGGHHPARRSGLGYHGATGTTGGSDHRDAPGGASRFFPIFRYEAKAPASERPRLPDGTAHPTIKPLALMRWLVRLVTPPGGLVLDPTAGTGTTLAAARDEGMRAIGVELDATSAELARIRLSAPAQGLLDFGTAS